MNPTGEQWPLMRRSGQAPREGLVRAVVAARGGAALKYSASAVDTHRRVIAVSPEGFFARRLRPTVPAGAVTQPTLFTLTVLATGYVEVDLLATVNTLFGILDVGSQGFAKPVPVTLTYSRGTNVEHPRTLTVLRIKSLIGYEKYEVMASSVDTSKQTVTAPLDHFSRYTLAYPAD